MKNIKLKSALFTVLIVFSIILLLFFNYYYFFLSPKMIEVNNVKNIVELFESENKKDVDFISRYFADKAYYTASDEQFLYVFDELGEIQNETLLSELSEERLISIANTYNNNYDLKFSIYDEKLVYVIEMSDQDIFIDIESLEVILIFDKGI